MDSTAPTAVYRYFDSRGVLIYVGITNQGTARNFQHVAHAEWWPFVAEQKVEHFPSRAAAEAKEKALIREFRPPFNRQHNLDQAEMPEAYLAFAASEIVDESFQDQYSRLGASLPLRIINESTFVTFIAHSVIAATLSLRSPTRLVVEGGLVVGRVKSLSKEGGLAVFHVDVSQRYGAVEEAVARLRVQSLKTPIATNVHSVKVVLEKGARDAG